MVKLFLTSKLTCLFLAITSSQADIAGSSVHSLLRGDNHDGTTSSSSIDQQRYLLNNGNHGGGNNNHNNLPYYGCIGSAGYSWCQSLWKCIRPWETTCPGGGGGGGGHDDGLVCGTVYEPVSCGRYDYSNLCEAKRDGYKAYQCTSINPGGPDHNPTMPGYCYANLAEGNCYGIAQAWGYDSSKGRCVQFTYGGCPGNQNNFNTQQECQRTCGGGGGSGPGIGCDRTYRPVICDGYYKYNNQCLAEAEGYTQCDCVDDRGGGGCDRSYRPVICDGYYKYNNQCLAEVEGYTQCDCVDDRGGGHHDDTNPYCPAYCSAELAKGNCYGVAKAWGYNSYTQKCEKFTYGGCPGNRNNFHTQQECQNNCSGCQTYSF